jgi:hypothetical protein
MDANRTRSQAFSAGKPAPDRSPRRRPRFTALQRLTFATGLACAAIGGAHAREARPAEHCLDARSVVSARHLDSGDFLLRAVDHGYLVSMHPDCRGELTEHDTLLSRAGWVCGSDEEYVKNEATRCPVVAVQRLEPREHARLAREHDAARARDGQTRLGTVEVLGKSRPGVIGHRGHPDYCFSPATVRGWQVSGSEVIVQTAPRRSQGRKQYRLTLASACPELDRIDGVGFHSGIGIGLICGNPGDRLVVASEPGLLVPDQLAEVGPVSLLKRHGCAIAEVHSDG